MGARGHAERAMTGPVALPSPSPSRVLWRALVGWGLGHIALGMRRGWLLLGGEVVAVAVLVVGLLPRAEGTFADIAFGGLVLFFLAWTGQAVDAYSASCARSSGDVEVTPGRGPLQVLVLVLPATVALTSFWLFAGGAASPTAALQQYVADWRGGDAGRASMHVVADVGTADLRTAWDDEAAYVEARLRALASELGPESGLDPAHPFASLAFSLDPEIETATESTNGETATAAISIVRQATVHEAFLGLFPAASQRSVAVERVGTVHLRLVELPAPFGIGPPDRGWRVQDVELAAPH
jgi:hypothetical protein